MDHDALHSLVQSQYVRGVWFTLDAASGTSPVLSRHSQPPDIGLILADVVKVKKGSGSTAHWSIDFIRLNGWLRRCFTLLITPLDIDGIGQNWEDSNKRDQHTGSDQGGQTGSQRRSYYHECHTNIGTWFFADGRPARMPKHEPVLSTGIICQIV